MELKRIVAFLLLFSIYNSNLGMFNWAMNYIQTNWSVSPRKDIDNLKDYLSDESRSSISKKHKQLITKTMKYDEQGNLVHSDESDNEEDIVEKKALYYHEALYYHVDGNNMAWLVDPNDGSRILLGKVEKLESNKTNTGKYILSGITGAFVMSAYYNREFLVQKASIIVSKVKENYRCSIQ